MNKIHETAIIDASVQLGENIKIGPYCIVGKDVKIEDGVSLISHVTINGKSTVGEGTIIWPFSVIGAEPQDMKYDGEEGSLIIGKHNSIREHSTMHTGTTAGGMTTTIGDNNLFMVGAHIAHDCIVGSNCVFANNATLGGHVEIGDWAILGGLSAVHQWARVGCHSFIGGLSAVTRDVIPYGMVVGNRARLEGLNLVGIRRRNFSKEEIKDAKIAYSLLFEDKNCEFKKRISKLNELEVSTKIVNDMKYFLESEGSRSYCLPDS